jgi:nitrite reductase/ring-hydroxylating ferredoxin subunit
VSRFVRVASVNDIPVGRGKTVAVDGLCLALFNAGAGRFHALSGACAHEDGPLGEGVLLGDRVVCPWHGFDFDVNTGVCGVAPDLAVSVYPVRVSGVDLLVELP